MPTPDSPPEDPLRWQAGGCHCGRVRFAVLAPTALTVEECNCSRCRQLGFLHLIVPRSRFRLERGQDALRTYTFNTGTAKHRFCEHCGVQSFYIPRSHPDGYSVNARCLDLDPGRTIEVRPFDGEHWEANIHRLDPLPPEDAGPDGEEPPDRLRP